MSLSLVRTRLTSAASAIALPLAWMSSSISAICLPRPRAAQPRWVSKIWPTFMRARHAERVEHDVDRGAVLEERHVLLRQDAADDALVAVAAGHLVARLQLALHRDEHLDHLEHARRQLVAALELLDAVLELRLDDRLPPRHTGLRTASRSAWRLSSLTANFHHSCGSTLSSIVGVDRGALLDALGRGGGGLAEQHLAQAGVGGALQDGALVLGVLARAGPSPRSGSRGCGRRCRCRGG